MYLKTLGGLSLIGVSYTRPKSLLLLTYLAMEGAQDRHRLSMLFFPHAQDRLASLRTTLKRLRQEVPGILRDDGKPLRIDLDCDALHLLALLDENELEQGVQGYAGAFLKGIRLLDVAGELEEWLQATREYLARRVRGALLTLAERHAARSEMTVATEYAERAAWLDGASDPEPEEFNRLGVLLAAGQSPSLERLRQQSQALGMPFEIPDVQAHPQPQDRPSSHSSDDKHVVPPSLPVRGTAFVGRTVERSEVLKALARPEVRLLTLVGPGGIGKTRLALEVAQHAGRPVAFAALETVTSLSDLPRTMAQATGLTLPEDRPEFDALTDSLREHRLLLILDGAEGLLRGWPDLSALLRTCPLLTVLVTSRERLDLEEEWVLTVGGLTVPPLTARYGQALAAEAVQLFVQRAKRAHVSFQVTPAELPAIQQICALVGGSPLGLELAAAWTRLIPVQDIAAEIRLNMDFLEATDLSMDVRHHSVRAVFNQTVARLSSTERQVLSNLSVFQAGFTRMAAGQVAGATLMSLARLIDKSLIQVDEGGRYSLHALILQYSRELLVQDPALAHLAQAALGDYVLDLCKQAGLGLREVDQERRWAERLALEHGNLQAALRWWLERGEVEPALSCLISLRNYWWHTGLMREGRTWLSLALQGNPNVSSSLLESGLMITGELAADLGDFAEAEQLLRRSAALSEARGVSVPLTHLALGNVHKDLGQLEAAWMAYERAREEFMAAGKLRGVGATLNNLAEVMLLQGDLAAAQQMLEEALAVKRQAGTDVESVLGNLADVYLKQGDYRQADELFRQALRGYIDRGVRFNFPEVIEGLGEVALEMRRDAEGIALIAAAASLRVTLQRSTNPEAEWKRQVQSTHTAIRLSDEEFDRAWTSGWAITAEAVETFVSDVLGAG